MANTLKRRKKNMKNMCMKIFKFALIQKKKNAHFLVYRFRGQEVKENCRRIRR